MRKFIFVLIICVMAPGTAANAALLNGIEGNVRVNKVSGFRTVTGATNVAPGDRVTVRGEGQALVQFDNGCVGRIAANQTVTIPTDPPCEPGAGADNTPLILGGLAVAGGVGIIIAVANDDDDPPPAPASP